VETLNAWKKKNRLSAKETTLQPEFAVVFLDVFGIQRIVGTEPNTKSF